MIKMFLRVAHSPIRRYVSNDAAMFRQKIYFEKKIDSPCWIVDINRIFELNVYV